MRHARRQRGPRFGAAAPALGLLALLAACQEVPPPEAPVPEPRTSMQPVARPDRPAPPEVPPRSDLSLALSERYARMQSQMLARGQLRGDRDPADVPFTDQMLARDFIRIALYDEYTEADGRLEQRSQLSRLRRWEQPIRMDVVFGDTVPQRQRDRDQSAITTYASRLARLTGHPIAQVPSGGNFTVMVLNEDDRGPAAAKLRALVPGISDSSVRAFLQPPPDTLCMVIALDQGGGQTYSHAIALIRGEHPDLLRLACIHEELAQGMGLVNDSPLARPSIFNDNEEFGLLTRHDELLLQMLYDDRLAPGMSAAEAAPIAREIARELMETPV
ncbi:DUF2927 domain-containing protein [Pseudoroseicyclus aestuarii]|uniref:DUF2927 family protein n=1 Tax=Pseudoroseicyclus aestuarii TaxID=1795041 RepID=A0A318SRZ4_9RHOB|nr:DUF2927 domain-containing protein [Pseudoroseicyclus aestuarii]PYE81269.1 hypothetical protein DFP88_10759 [Pseudoroseicyclus aestuarii]